MPSHTHHHIHSHSHTITLTLSHTLSHLHCHTHTVTLTPSPQAVLEERLLNELQGIEQRKGVGGNFQPAGNAQPEEPDLAENVRQML